MVDHDPTSRAGNEGEFYNAPKENERISRALGDLVRKREEMEEADRLLQSAIKHINELQASADRAQESQRTFATDKRSASSEYRDANLDIVISLADILETEDMSVEEGLSLIQLTLTRLDDEVLDNVNENSGWHTVEKSDTPAIVPIDYANLQALADKIVELPADEYVGFSDGSKIYVALPKGKPYLRLAPSTERWRETVPFPFEAKIGIAIDRDDTDEERQSFEGDILVGSSEIAENVLNGLKSSYTPPEYVITREAEWILDSFKNAQAGFTNIRNNRIYDKLSPEQKRGIDKRNEISSAAFAQAISSHPREVLRSEAAKLKYEKILRNGYFDLHNYRKTVNLIDALYGDGTSDINIELAAYTQVLAQIFEGEGADSDRKPTKIDLLQAELALRLSKQ